MYDLQVIPQSGALADFLGGRVELRELSYGGVRDAMATAARAGDSAEQLLGESLHIAGIPIGVEKLRTLPGRHTGEVGRLLGACLALHGMGAEPEGTTQGEA